MSASTALAQPSVNTNAVANPDNYFLVAGNTLSVAESARGVMANDIGVYGVQLLTAPTGGTLTLNANGTFTYVPNAGTVSDSFTYCANGTVTGTTCSTGLTATVTLAACTGTCLGGSPDSECRQLHQQYRVAVEDQPARRTARTISIRPATR